MYTLIDFNTCKYNPLEVRFAEKYKHLFDIVPDTYQGDKVALLKYVCLMYDPKSPLISDTASIDNRKRTAAIYAGIKQDTEYLDTIFELKDEAIIEVIDRFLKEHINERLWYMIQGNEQTFYEYGKRLLQPVIDVNAKEKDLLSAIAIKSKLSEDMAIINIRLENDYRKLFMDDTQIQKAVSAKRFNPESIATL